MHSAAIASPDPLDAAAEDFLRVRPRLFGIAYRMLGSVAEAEDVTQDAWLRWQTTDRAVVRDSTAFLVTTATRLAINRTQLAHVQRETYIGPWLPEPVDTAADPTLGAERAEALDMAVLLLLEKLSPVERAAYVLREAFDYTHRVIADILQLNEANVRQLVTRARKHIASERHAAVPVAMHRRLLQAFLHAAQQGDAAALEQMFASDIVSLSDGGGKANAARIPVLGREKVAKFVASFASHFWQGASAVFLETNGASSVALLREGRVYGALAISGSEEGIERLFWTLNPDKLPTMPTA
jgi:RNA polymerase sigma-70 factor (ECF subfamily)